MDSLYYLFFIVMLLFNVAIWIFSHLLERCPCCKKHRIFDLYLIEKNMYYKWCDSCGILCYKKKLDVVLWRCEPDNILSKNTDPLTFLFSLGSIKVNEKYDEKLNKITLTKNSGDNICGISSEKIFWTGKNYYNIQN